MKALFFAALLLLTPFSLSRPHTKTTPDVFWLPHESSAPLNVLNGRALKLAMPSYPAKARKARASGTVVVKVLIDEEGKVIAAKAISGHPLLLDASVEAAKNSLFSPTLLGGKPVKVDGVIQYNFVER